MLGVTIRGKKSVIKKMFISMLLVSLIVSSLISVSSIEHTTNNSQLSHIAISDMKNNSKYNLEATQDNIPIGAIGIPYIISLTIGNSTFYQYYLESNKTYVINLYGGFVDSKADYDVFVYDKNFTRLKFFANDPGMEELGTFTPHNTSWYYVQVQNNPITSKEISYAILLIIEQLNITKNDKNKFIHINNLSGGNKTHPVEDYNSSYGYIIDVSELQEMNLTFRAMPTNNLGLQMAIFQFTSTADKLTYSPLNFEKSDSLIKSANGNPGKEINVFFVVGRRGTEHANDTTIVLFIKATRGTGNVTIGINMVKTNIQIDILPYTSAIVVSIVVFIVIAFSEEKLRR